MRPLERALVGFVILGVAGIAAMATTARIDTLRAADEANRRAGQAARAASDSAFADSVLALAAQENPEVRVETSALAAPERDAGRIAHVLGTRTAGSYLGELLTSHDSMNHRWPDRRLAPMRVWVQELDGEVPGWLAAYPQLVRDAFSAWGAAGVPIHFTFVTDSARGEIHVTWTDRFESEVTGRTRWAHDQHRWIVGGSIMLALHLPDGRPLGREAVRAIALHEVGHLIGLDHTADGRNIMSPRVRVSELSEADQLTARLVYSLPPGSLKGPR
jgi:hypothetical protein